MTFLRFYGVQDVTEMVLWDVGGQALQIAKRA
jgi:hypothetical protein